jgi:hypothetical protein
MIRYGNIQVNKYHGLLDFGVALDGYKDRDFDIPISLKYISSGFTPAKRPSFVGYNWVLSCGGVITRTLNGSPDDTRGRYRNTEGNDYLVDGILVAIRENRFTNYSEKDLTDFNVELNGKGGGTPYENGDFKYEFEPDIFTFTFGNYYGRFIIGKSGIPILLEENGCKIDITGMPIQSYSTTETPINSSITITTPDGYIYTFGGESKYFEYFIPNNPPKCKVMPRYITSWFLKSIKAPNNRTVNFNYHSAVQLNKYRYISYLETVSETQTVCSPLGQGGGEGSSVDNNLELEKPLIKDKIYTPILNSISIDNIKIDFTYDENVAPFYSDEPNDKSIQLKKITHYANNISLKEAAFTYQSKNRYFFLKSVSEKGLKHEFTYNLSGTLPDPLTLSTDHWGFWTGGYETETGDWKDYCLKLKDNRKVNPIVCDIGLLNTIKYPTGGMTKITYEHNRYSTYFTRFTTTLWKWEANEMQNCGGARVSKLQDFENLTNTSSINTRQFYYQNSEQKEVGVIGIDPKYILSEAFLLSGFYTFPYATGNLLFPIAYGSCTVGTTTYITSISGNSYGSNNLFSEYHIAYPFVKEVFKDNSSILYKFSSLIDIPDSYDTGVKITYLNFSTLGMYGIAEKYGTLFTNDKSRFRGRLLEETIYDDSGNIVEQKTNKYNFEDAEIKYNISLKSSPRSFGYYKIYLTPCLLTQQSKTDENGVREEVYNTYNTQNLMRSTSTKNSKGEEYMKRYKYSADYALNNSQTNDNLIISTMISKNMLDYLAEEQMLIKEGGNWNLLNGKLIKYHFPNGTSVSGPAKPLEEYGLETSTPLTDIEESKIVASGALSFNSHYKKRMTYNKYTVYGNPLYISKDDADKTVYLWGYSYQYPIAEIKNATYEQVIEKISSTTLMNIAIKAEPSASDSTTIHNLRTQLPNAQVTTYMYQPLVGIRTMIDPREVKTTYHYDSFGRLQAIKDENDETIGTYDYHYKIR